MSVPTKSVIHPLVLLSSVDHYNRVAKDTKKRVVGVLLGEVRKFGNNVIADVTNSFAGKFAFEINHSDLFPNSKQIFVILYFRVFVLFSSSKTVQMLLSLFEPF